MRIGAAAAGTSLQPKRPEQHVTGFNARLKAVFEKNGAPSGSWMQFRMLARTMFGDGVLMPKRPGDEVRRLDLTRAQVRQLAEHPGKIRQQLQAFQAEGRFPKDSGKWSTAEAASLISKTARRTIEPKRANFTVATVNDDFTDRKTNLKGIDADVMLVQEAKNTNVRKTLKKDAFGVHQDRSSADRAGSAVVWDKDEVEARKSGFALGVRPRGHAMLTRWISYTDVKIDGVKVRMASVHRPPPRDSALWKYFDANLARFVKNTKGPIIIGMDANERTPRGLEKATGLKWHAPKGSIDGFLASPGIQVDRMRRLPKATSDHHPVMARFRVTQR